MVLRNNYTVEEERTARSVTNKELIQNKLD